MDRSLLNIIIMIDYSDVFWFAFCFSGNGKGYEEEAIFTIGGKVLCRWAVRFGRLEIEIFTQAHQHASEKLQQY